MRRSISGFTIVEMVVVIAVIGILATLVLTNFNGTQEKARDSKRISDLQAIADAIKLYRTNYGNDIQDGSGCGYAGNGGGWFNASDGNSASYPASILSCLTAKGYLNSSYIDPAGCTSASSSCPTTYMKYTCGTGDAAITYLYARMEKTDDSATLKSLNVCYSNTVATNYGMNYMIIVN